MKSEEILDLYFPKGDKRRGEALVLFASLVNELENRCKTKIKKIKDKAIKDDYGNFTIDIDEIDKICEEEKE